MKSGTRKGFTLVEMMIVIAIAAILLMAALPAMRSMSANSLADRLYRDLELDLRYARSQSSTIGQSISFEPVNSWKGGWKITDVSTNTVIRERKLTLAANTLSSATLKTGSPLIFDPKGRTSADATISISVPECSGQRKRTLLVNRIGQVILTGVAKC